MPRPPKVNADLIAGLRTLALAHNAACPEAPAKLNELKKVWIHGWRRARGSRAGAEAAVDKHLKKLAAMAADARSVDVLAKAEFDEMKHRRDGDGRFASKGGAPTTYSRVRTPAQHQAARADNEGYRAATTQVIPETRGATFGPLVGIAAGLALGRMRGARADKMPGPLLRAGHRWFARAAGTLAGGMAGAGRAAGERVSNRMRRAAGEPTVDVVGAAGETAERVGGAVRRGTKKVLDGATRTSLYMSRRVIANAKQDAADAGLTEAARNQRMRQARKIARRAGIVMPGIPLAYAGYHAGQAVGPLYDATVGGRRMEKVAADPRSIELLQKRVNLSPALRAIGSKLQGMVARRTATGIKGAAKPAGSRLLSQNRRSVGVGAALGAGLGAAAGGAAGARRYYRDKDGKFTSKERDVSGMLGAAAGGALAGALAGAAFVRGRNRAVARTLAEKFGQTKVNTPAGEVTLGEARRLMSRGQLKAKDVEIPNSNEGLGAFASRLRRRVAHKMSSKMEAEGKVLLAREQAIRGANRTWQGWQHFQIENALRQKIASLGGEAAFKRPAKGLDPHAAFRRLITTMPGERTITTAQGGKLATPHDPLGDIIAHVRATDAAKAAKRKAPDAPEIFKQLTQPQRTAIESAVRRADASRANFDAAWKTGVGDVEDNLTRISEAHQKAARHAQSLVGKKDVADEVKAAAREEADKLFEQLGAARKAADKARDALPLAEDPFRAGQRLLPQLGPSEAGGVQSIKDFIAADAKAIARVNARREKLLAEANATALRAGQRKADTLEAAGRRTATERGVQAVAAPAARAARDLGRQVKLIVGDAKTLTAPRAKMAYEAAKQRSTKIFEAGKAIAAGVNEHAIKPIGQWAKTNPRSAGSIFSVLGLGTGLGLVDVAADGELDFRFDRASEAAKHLIDKNTRPKAKMIWLNNGKDVAYVMVGRTKPRKGQEATEVILSGRIIKDKGDEQPTQIVSITPMTPLRMFVQNNQGGGGQGGGRGLQISGNVAASASRAIEALRRDTKIQRSADDDEDAYEFRHKDDTSQQGPAAEYLKSVMENANRSRGGTGFYDYLGSVFGGNGALLQEREKRRALFGGKRDGKPQNDGLINGGAIFDAFHNQDGQKFLDGMKERITRLPEPDDAQAASLRHLVTLAQRSGSWFDNAKANELRSAIEARRAGGATDGAGSAAPKAPRAPSVEQFSFDPNSDAARRIHRQFEHHTARIGFPEAVVEKDGKQVVDYRKIPDRVREQNKAFSASRLQEAREAIEREKELGRNFATHDDYYKAILARAVKDYSFERAVLPGDLAKASIALLAKAEIPQVGMRRQFEESRHRRSPKGSDRGGEFTSQGGGGSSGRRGERDRPHTKERDYFEPVRFGGTVGQAAGAQAGYELATRFLPAPLRSVGLIGRLAYRLTAATVGGGAAQAAGEALGREAYHNPRKAPGSWEPPRNRSLGEEASRMLGSAGGSMLSALSRSPVKGFTIGLGGQLAGEELAAAAHGVISKHYGQEAAARAARASLPRQAAAA